MSTTSDLTIIIPAKNEAILLPRLLNSLAEQGFSAMPNTKVYERLILLGDIFCDLNFGRLKKDHWRLLSYIRKLSNPKRGIEVVWVEGNHDHGLSLVMSHLVGIKVYQQYVWEYRGVRHLAVHGHQFDRFLTDNALLGSLASAAFLLLQKLDFRQQRFTQL